MADLTFGCPHCKQNIACDEQWSGQEIQCPLCNGSLVVPGAQSKKQTNPLVPKPPGASRLALGQTPGPAQTGVRNIPIRTMTGPVAKKKSPLVGILCGTAVVLGLAAGGYFGYGWYMGRQQQTADQKPGNAADATAGAPQGRQRRNADAAAPAADTTASAQPSEATNAPPPKPATWTLEVAQATIPDGQVNGKISGTNFLAETVRIDPVGTAQVLRLIQGQLLSPDREILIYLHLKPGEKLGGQTLTISSDMKGTAVPQVAKRWKINPRYAPSIKTYYTGYAMKLELAKPADDGIVPGKIFLALPDPEQTVVAGTFKTTVTQPDPNAQPVQYQTPTPTTAGNPDAANAFQKRYGIRR